MAFNALLFLPQAFLTGMACATTRGWHGATRRFVSLLTYGRRCRRAHFQIQKAGADAPLFPQSNIIIRVSHFAHQTALPVL